jgi:teichuronic acid biosynthesis glycosyltransferase TuaG
MEKTNPLISIITPAFNAETYLPETIESILNQTYKNWELLITDDASTDETEMIVRDFQNIDIRIKYFKLTINSGAAIARQESIDKRNGNMIAFLDSDDLWLPEKLEVQLDFMKREKSCFSYTGFRRISYDGIEVGRQISVPESLDFKNLLKNTAIATSSVMIDLERIGEIKFTPGFLHEDFILWLEILQSGFVANGFNKDLMRYRILKNSLSRNKVKSIHAVWRIYREKFKIPLHLALFNFFSYAFNAIRKYKRF